VLGAGGGHSLKDGAQGIEVAKAQSEATLSKKVKRIHRKVKGRLLAAISVRRGCGSWSDRLREVVKIKKGRVRVS